MFDIEKSSATYKSPLLTFPACSLLSYTQIDRRILGTRLIFFIIYYYIRLLRLLVHRLFVVRGFIDLRLFWKQRINIWGPKKKLIKPFFFPPHTGRNRFHMPGFNQIQQASRTDHRLFPACVLKKRVCGSPSANKSSWSNSIRYHRRYLKERLQSSSTKEASAFHLLQQNPVSTKTFDGEHYFRVLHEMVGFYIRLEVRWHFFCSC